MSGIPKTSDDLTPAWLSEALKSGGITGCDVASVECGQFGQGVGMISDLYRLKVGYRDSAAKGPADLVVKLSSARPESRFIATTYNMYDREVRFYRDIAPTISMSSARAYCARSDVESGDSVLLLADLSPAQSADQLGGMPLDEVEVAFDEVSKLHAYWWDHADLPAMEASMPQLCKPPYSYSETNFQTCWPAADAYLTAQGLPDLHKLAERLATQLQRLSEDVCEGPRTLCHGDFRADNLMFRRDGGKITMTAVDWQLLMQARGPLDIGYLMGGHVSSELRREHEQALLRRYHNNLLKGGVTGYDFEQCFYDYRRCILVGVSYAVQALPTMDPSNPRAVELFRSWTSRLNAAIVELGLDEFVH